MLRRLAERKFWGFALAAGGVLAAGLTAYGFWNLASAHSTPTTDLVRQAVAAGRWERAEALLNRLAGERVPPAQIEVLRAELDVARGLPDQAVARLRAIAATETLAAHARTMAGQIEKKRARARPAEALFLEALRLDPSLTLPRQELIFIYGMQVRRTELNAQYRELARTSPLGYDDVFLWTTSLEGDIWINDTIRPTLEGFLAADPEDRASRLALAQVLIRSNDLDRAESTLAPLPSSDLDVQVIRARLALARRDPDEARRIIGDGADENAQLAVLRGRIAMQASDLEKAAAHFRRALVLDPANREAIHGMALVLSRTGQTEDARRFLDQEARWRGLTELLLKANTQDARHDKEALRQLAAHCEAVDERDEARAWYQLALALDPADSALQQSLYRLRERSP